jgi:hypothetical protein
VNQGQTKIINNKDRPQRECPYCKEKIIATSRKCRFCGEWMDPGERRFVSAVRGSASARAVSQGIKLKNYDRMALKFKFFLLICIPGVALAFIYHVLADMLHLHLEENRSTSYGYDAPLLLIWAVIFGIGGIRILTRYYRE